VVDEFGCSFVRGVPQTIDSSTATLLQSLPYKDLFILSEKPVELTPQDRGWSAVLPEETPCVWEGHFALMTGPFIEAADDDHHVYHCGAPLEICSKTLKVLNSDEYRRHFAVINRGGEGISQDPVPCGPTEGCC